MPFPPEVNNLRIKDATEFDNFGNVMKTRVYTFYVGNHGPFTEKFYAGEQDTPAVERRINLLVLALREQGVLTTPPTQS
jgi:hypothetical protein